MILHVNARCRHFYTTRNSIAFRLARLAPTTTLILSNLQSHFRRTQEFFSAQEKVPFAFTAGRPFTYIYIGKNPRCCLILLGEWGDEKEKVRSPSCVHEPSGTFFSKKIKLRLCLLESGGSILHGRFWSDGGSVSNKVTREVLSRLFMLFSCQDEAK